MQDVLASQDQAIQSSGAATIAKRKATTMGFFEKRGIDPELAVKYGFKESGGRIEFEYRKNGECVYKKYRTADKQFSCDAGKKPFFWNFDAIQDETINQPIVITEGEIDAISAIQAGFVRTISVPNGSQGENGNLDYLDEVLPYLRMQKEIIIASDGDDKGAGLLQALAIRIGKVRCKWVRYPKECKDLNDVLLKYGLTGIRETLKRSDWVEVLGDYGLLDLPPLPYAKPFHIGIAGFENHLNIRMGDFSIVTGVPSSGKSTFINDVLCRLVENHKFKPAIASFEQPPQQDHRRAFRTWKNKKLEKNMTEQEKQTADRWVHDNFRFIVPSEDDDVTLEWLLEVMAACVLRSGVNMIVIDPWNEMDHDRPSDMTVTEYTGYAIKELKRFAKKYMVHVMVIAHPAKMRRDKDGDYPVPTLYDISDSAHWNNKADLGIVVHRSTEGDFVQVQKSRYHAEIGKPAVVDVNFNPETGRFSLIDNDVLNGRSKGR